MAVRLGVDVGGTVTDLILFDESSGSVRVGKTLTQPRRSRTASRRSSTARPRRAASIATRSSCTARPWGSTRCSNARGRRRAAHDLRVPGRAGAAPGQREHMFDLLWRPADPLVPRRLRLPIGERTRADGALITPVDGEDVRRAVDVLAAEEISSVAVVASTPTPTPPTSWRSPNCCESTASRGRSRSPTWSRGVPGVRAGVDHRDRSLHSPAHDPVPRRAGRAPPRPRPGARGSS